MVTNNKEKILTSVKLDPTTYENFRIKCVGKKMNLQKLTERSLCLYNENEEFRKMIHNYIIK